MERQGWENNDFSGGFSDEYIPSKDNRLDSAENICLDDDLTPIQRPGSGKLEGADSNFGKNADQLKVKGLQENTKELFAFNDNIAFSYNKTSVGGFTRRNPDSGTPDLADASPTTFKAVQPIYPPVTSKVPVSGGSVNTFQMRDIVYAASSKGSFPQKFYTDDILGNRAGSIGLPRLPEMFYLNGDQFVPHNRCALSLWYYDTNTVIQTKGTPVPVAMSSANASFSTPQATDTWGWSDRPYTYVTGQEAPVKTFTNVYAFTYVLRWKYTIDGIVYEKRSAPVTPSYFLSDTPLTTTTVAPNTLRTYSVGVQLNLLDIYELMRDMNLPFFDEGALATAQVDRELIIECYMTDNNGTVLTSRQDQRNLGVGTDFIARLTRYYSRVNRDDSTVDTRAVPAGNTTAMYPAEMVSGSTIVVADFFLKHDRSAAEEFTSLYTEGGVLPYDPPPPSKYIFLAGTYAFYLNIKELTVNEANTYSYQAVPYRLKISNANDPDSVPEGNLVDVPDELMGGGAVLDRAIVGTVKEIYRIDGRYDSLGSGLVNAQLLSSETGLLSHKTVVSVKDRLFFCGDDGIYVTDGVGVLCISRHITRTYRSLIAAVASDSTGDYVSINRELCQEKLSAVYDRVNDRILFSFGNYVLALELKASQLESGYGAFYGAWFTGFNKSTAPESFSALGIFKDLVVRGDEYGYVTQMSAGYLSDPRISNAVSPSLWGRYPVIYRLRTTKLAFGSLTVKKWVNYVSFILKRRKVLQGGETEIDVQVNAYNDGERVRQTLRPAHYNGERDNVFDESPKVAGILVPKVLTDTLVNFQRRFGSSGLRCVTKAVEFTNGMNLVGKSDDVEEGIVSTTFVSLPNYPTTQWPKEAQDLNQTNYVIAFDYDGYAQKFLVTAASAATLTLDQAPVAGQHKWKLYSFSTKQFFGLHSLAVIYTPFASKHSTYLLSEQGGNVGDTGE